MGLCGLSGRGSVRKVGVLEMYKKRQHQAETQWCAWHSDTNTHTQTHTHTCALGVYLLSPRQLHTEVIISSCCMLVDPTHQCSKAWAACLSHSKGFFFQVCAQVDACLHVLVHVCLFVLKPRWGLRLPPRGVSSPLTQSGGGEAEAALLPPGDSLSNSTGCRARSWCPPC